MINVTINAEEYKESVREAFDKLFDSEFLNYTADDYKPEAIIKHAIERTTDFCEELPFNEFINHFVSLWKPCDADIKDDGTRTLKFGYLRGEEGCIHLPYEAFMGKVTPLSKEPLYEGKPMPLCVNGLYNYKPSEIFEGTDDAKSKDGSDANEDDNNPDDNIFVLLHYGEPSITESGTKLQNWRMSVLDLSDITFAAKIISLHIVETQTKILEAIQRNPSILAVNGDVTADGEYIGNFYCEAVHKELIEKVYYEEYELELEGRIRTLKNKLYNWGLIENETANIIK